MFKVCCSNRVFQSGFPFNWSFYFNFYLIYLYFIVFLSGLHGLNWRHYIFKSKSFQCFYNHSVPEMFCTNKFTLPFLCDEFISEITDGRDKAGLYPWTLDTQYNHKKITWPDPFYNRASEQAAGCDDKCWLTSVCLLPLTLNMQIRPVRANSSKTRCAYPWYSF